jgi:hypothetical protein
MTSLRKSCDFGAERTTKSGKADKIFLRGASGIKGEG